MKKGNINIFEAQRLQVRGKTDTIPIAQNTTLCGLDGSPARGIAISNSVCEALAKRDVLVKHLYIVLSITGCRISEALAIKHNNIGVNGSFVIVGKKGSRSRMYKISELSDFFIQCKKDNVYPFCRLNRFYVYRLFKSCGIMHKFEGNEKYSVTHLPRHLLAIEAKQMQDSEGLVTDSLRHKSVKNAKFYEKER